MKAINIILVLLSFIFSTMTFAQNVHFVDNNANGTANGQNWLDAFNSIQSAVTNATSGDTIKIAQGTYNITSTVIVQNKNLVLIGGYDVLSSTQLGYSNLVSSSSRIFLLENLNDSTLLNGFVITGWSITEGAGINNTNSDARFENLIFMNNLADVGSSGLGGGIYNNNSNSTFNNIEFISNTAFLGGAMNNFNSNVIITNCNFEGNLGRGGAIRSVYGTTTIINGTFTSNSTLPDNSSSSAQMFNNGGAINISFVTLLSLDNCIFNDNFSHRKGGAIYSHNNSQVSCLNSNFYGNETALVSGGSGGSVYIEGGSLAVLNSSLINSRSYSGGALTMALGCATTMSNTQFDDNFATVSGGAINEGSGIFFGEDLTFLNNRTNNFGGAITMSGVSDTLIGSYFENNWSNMGGAIHYASATLQYLSNCQFQENYAFHSAGAINGANLIHVDSCDFNGNHAPLGGAVRNFTNTFMLATSCNFVNNYNSGNSTHRGGAIEHYGTSSNGNYIGCVFESNVSTWGGAVNSFESSPTFTDCYFVENTATWGGAVRGERSNAIFNNVIFENNTGSSGGAVNNVSNFTVYYPSFTGCKFIQNTAGYGGAMYNTFNHPRIENTVFHGNTANGGGAVYNNNNAIPKFYNVLFSNNEGLFSNSAVMSENSQSATYLNVTVFNNISPLGIPAMNNNLNTSIFRNCVFWENSFDLTGLFSISSTVINPNFTRNAFHSQSVGVVAGVNIIALNDNPFVNSNNLKGADNIWGTLDDGLYPNCFSPLFNEGLNFNLMSNLIDTITTDISNQIRIQQGNIEIGAYERIAGSNFPTQNQLSFCNEVFLNQLPDEYTNFIWYSDLDQWSSPLLIGQFDFSMC